ncbi:MAG: hypothetical protein ACFFA6_01850 [Promethearchaeota archaeon]
MESKSFYSDIVILGHIAKDIIEIDGKSKESLGGAVYYGGIAGSHMGLKVSIITRLSKEDFSILEVFKKNGIKYFAYPSKQTSGLRNIYSSHRMESREYQPLGFAGSFKKEEIPIITTKFFIIAPITSGEVDVELLEYIQKNYNGNLCLDIQGFIRFRENNKVIYKKLSQDEKDSIFSKVKILKLDQTEAFILTNQKSINKALKKLISFGPEEILITHEKGISVNVSDNIYFFPWENRLNIGRTGRGDTAFVSYVGSRISRNPKDALKFSAALTSLKLESSGPFSLPLYQVYELEKKFY